MIVEIPNDILHYTDKSESEVKLEIAIFLYSEMKVPSGKCAEFAGISRVVFLNELGKRHIPVQYDEKSFQEDLSILNEPEA